MLPQPWGQTPRRASFPVSTLPTHPPTPSPTTSTNHSSARSALLLLAGNSAEILFLVSECLKMFCCVKLCCIFLPSCLSLLSGTSGGWTRRGHASNFFGFPAATGTVRESPPEQKKNGPGAGGAKCQRVLRLRLICTFHTCARFYFLPFVS